MARKPIYTDEQLAAWKRRREIMIQARFDMKAKFPKITLENFQAAMRYQEQRVSELLTKQTEELQ